MPSALRALTLRRFNRPVRLLRGLHCLVINRLTWPESEYLINPDRKWLYAPVAKVACSSLKRWFLAAMNHEIPPGSDEHTEAKAHRLRELPAARALRILADERYFRFALVRNPWARLVSAYVNKFTFANHSSLAVARQMRRQAAEGGVPEITFAQFVGFLTRHNPAGFDVHWRPQHLFLRDNQFHFLGRFEQISEHFAQLQERLGTELPLPRRNTTAWQRDEDGEIVADWTPAELLAQGRPPGYRRFYTPELREAVRKLYARDIELFGYEFDAG
jgi:hypothetical protein